jgi:hypothetical protein
MLNAENTGRATRFFLAFCGSSNKVQGQWFRLLSVKSVLPRVDRACRTAS